MKFRNTVISSAVAAALGSAVPVLALAQAAGDQSATGKKSDQPAQLEEIVVTGIRESLQNAQELKRKSDTIQDSIVAEDIGKLPDVTAVEALQRITGIQIGRDLGEGGGSVTIGGSAVNSGLVVRGLPQVETTLNGREVFSAGGSRVLNFEDIPSTLLAGIDVYKDPTANLLEGGIGGTVDLRTRKPFDFKGLEVEASVAEHYADLRQQARPEATALISDRFQTDIGEIGALLSFGYQDRAYREDSSGVNSPYVNKTLLPGQLAVIPAGWFNDQVMGDRKRTGVDGVLQWQPQDNLQVYAEAGMQELDSNQDQYITYLNSTNAPITAATFFPNSNIANQVSWANQTSQSWGSWRDVTDVNRQYAVNAKWSPGPLTITGDVSYSTATEFLQNPTFIMLASGVNATQTITQAGIPNDAVGANLTQLSTFTGGQITDNQNHYDGNEKAYRLDADWALSSGFFTMLSAGVRLGDRVADFNAVRPAGENITAAAMYANPQLFGLIPGDPFYSKTQSGAVIPRTLVPSVRQLENNLAGLTSTLGIAVPATQTVATNQSWHQEEKNTSFYLRANFEADIGVPMDGNIGVRAVRVQDFVNGYLTNPGPPVTFTPANLSSSHTDALPSLNLRWKLTDELQARFAASKTVTHPDFSQLAPSYNLIVTSQTATGGNPKLAPTKATQLDGSLEWYFGPAASVTGGVFYKKISDFVEQLTTPGLVIDGVTYNLTGPANGGNGTVKGFEFGYQQFFDFLPGLWSGLGVQATYTYADSNAPSSVAGLSTTLPGLSRNSFNLVGMYEKGPLSARVAYNWRSTFYTSIYTGANAALPNNPIYTKDLGWLDASLTYDVTHQFSVYVQGSNLLRTRLEQYIGTPLIPNSFAIDDRQYTVGVRFKL